MPLSQGWESGCHSHNVNIDSELRLRLQLALTLPNQACHTCFQAPMQTLSHALSRPSSPHISALSQCHKKLRLV